MMRHGEACCGMARHVEAWLGMSRHGGVMGAAWARKNGSMGAMQGGMAEAW